MNEAALAALRAGDEAAFARLVEELGPSMLRLAMTLCPSRAVAEEAVQETWASVVRSLPGLRSGGSVRAWVFAILVNAARRIADRERRSLPFATLGDPDGPAVDPAAFHDAGANAGHWRAAPTAWELPTHDAAAMRETHAAVATAIDALPPAQRTVVLLRDVEGLPGPEAAEVLGISQGHLRVLLHRGRAHVRRALETHLAAG